MSIRPETTIYLPNAQHRKFPHPNSINMTIPRPNLHLNVCFQCHNRSITSYCIKCNVVTAPTGKRRFLFGKCNPWNKPYPGNRNERPVGKETILELVREDEAESSSDSEGKRPVSFRNA
jgi:hypothetical protein